MSAHSRSLPSRPAKGPEQLLTDPRTRRPQPQQPERESLDPGGRRVLQQTGGVQGRHERHDPFNGKAGPAPYLDELTEPVATVHQLQQRAQCPIGIGEDHRVGGVETELEVVLVATEQRQMGPEAETTAEIRRSRVEDLHLVSVRP